MTPKYRTILADPPWPERMTGSYLLSRHFRPAELVYPTMRIEEIKAMPIGDLAETGAHLWLWVTDQFLHEGFHVMESWGFKYLAPIVWRKPSGLGNYFIHRTEFLLFGYKNRCAFNRSRYIPNDYDWPTPLNGEPINDAPTWRRPRGHSRKPPESYDLIESVSDEPRLELFARPITPMFPKINGWDVFGNEVQSDIAFNGGL
jgi:N6-adenosine-specific RNA methylase IME4